MPVSSCMPSRCATINGTLKLSRLGRLSAHAKGHVLPAVLWSLEASRHSRPRAAINGNPETCRIGKVDGFENLEAIATATPSFAVLLHWGSLIVSREWRRWGVCECGKRRLEVFVFIRFSSRIVAIVRVRCYHSPALHDSLFSSHVIAVLFRDDGAMRNFTVTPLY